jgi:SOUL heme-binding protein
MQSANILVAAALAVALNAASPGVAMAYEEPRFERVANQEGFEVRRYAAYWVAETRMSGESESARGEAFRRLFNYISGNNRAQQSIEMTVPVVTAESQRIEMTAPVMSRPAEDGTAMVMQFVLPARFDGGNAPQPIDPRVQLRRIEGETVAVRSYSGRSNEANYLEHEAELLRLLDRAQVPAGGAPRFAVYNGPFTPWFMRRNEVIVPLAQAAGAPARP